jgi:hypothetical protein
MVGIDKSARGRKASHGIDRPFRDVASMEDVVQRRRQELEPEDPRSPSHPSNWVSPTDNPKPYEQHFEKNVDMSQMSRVNEIPNWKLAEKHKSKNWKTMEDLSNCHPYTPTSYNDNYLSYEDGW